MCAGCCFTFPKLCLFEMPWTAALQAPLSSTISWSLLKLISLCLSSIFPSVRVFSNESVLHIRWHIGVFNFSIRPSNEHSGLISFRVDWLDLLAVQGTQESSPTPQFKSFNSLVLSFHCSPTLTSIHDYWRNHSFNWTDLLGSLRGLVQ